MGPPDVGIVIRSGLPPQYDTKIRILKSSSDWPIRQQSERAVIDQFDLLRFNQSAAWGKPILTERGNGCNLSAPPIAASSVPAQIILLKGARCMSSTRGTKRDQEANGGENNGHSVAGLLEADSEVRGGGTSKHRQRRGGKSYASNAIFYGGPHMSDDCSHPTESAVALAVSAP